MLLQIHYFCCSLMKGPSIFISILKLINQVNTGHETQAGLDPGIATDIAISSI